MKERRIISAILSKFHRERGREKEREREREKERKREREREGEGEKPEVQGDCCRLRKKTQS